MSRYIDAELIRVIAKNDRLLQGNAEWEFYKQKVDAYVDSLPSIDIVRCGECKHWHSGECWGIPYRGDYDTSIDTKADDFCSYGCSSEKPNKSERSSE